MELRVAPLERLHQLGLARHDVSCGGCSTCVKLRRQIAGLVKQRLHVVLQLCELRILALNDLEDVRADIVCWCIAQLAQVSGGNEPLLVDELLEVGIGAGEIPALPSEIRIEINGFSL